ncbi:hypothetical protein Goshw_020298, partial [Gossypium schwendimanii]|nr:hypothetical protein [Gossypium schwendimanii]
GSEKLVFREVFTSVQGSGSLLGYIRTYVFVRFSSLCSHREMYSPEPNSAQWDDKVKQLCYSNYGDLPYLFDIKVDEYLFRALAQFWNPAYSCFTFGEIDLVPTIEEYTVLLHYPRIQADKVYSKAVNVPTFVKKLVNILEMIHPDMKKKVDVFALSIYGLMIFPRALGSLSACRSAGEGRFIGCAQLLLVWFHSHLWKVDKVSYRVFSKNYSPLKELAATPRRDNITEERLTAILQNLIDEDVEWKAPWMVPDESLYRCGDFDWVPLLGIWGVVGYTSLMVLKQFGSRQFVPSTQGLA